MRILVKLPTRERPQRLMEAYRAAISKAKEPKSLSWLFAVDDDDKTAPIYFLNQIGEVATGPRISKIEACNRGMPGDKPWDIVVLMSDDMLCRVDGWDEIIRQDMAQHFPDTDGCLWYPDGYQDRLCTLPVMGRAYFDHFGYIYHPSYKSLWCDNEQHEVAEAQGKLWKSDKTLFEHMHCVWGKSKRDDLYKHNNRFDRVDHDTYIRRKALNFSM